MLALKLQVTGSIAEKKVNIGLHARMLRDWCLIVEFVYENRLVYKWSHLFVANITRRRYFANTGELKRAHGLIADLFVNSTPDSDNASSARSGAALLFPRPLKRDDGTVNTRKVHNLWYHLLHTGN
ncbi:unnamed protein product [Gongylonema pulchrum]|uniref:NWD1/2-like winged helix-turn-helix domain-containing protein n=1 Tax=Gongylonema pulchrum TaxID=637853 RepID=A0A183DEY7_9BILA|nr:unnamed protein product [Gongylonema pulchrum]